MATDTTAVGTKPYDPYAHLRQVEAVFRKRTGKEEGKRKQRLREMSSLTRLGIVTFPVMESLPMENILQKVYETTTALLKTEHPGYMLSHSLKLDLETLKLPYEKEIMTVVSPIVQYHFTQRPLQLTRCVLVQFGEEHDAQLDIHKDDADVTINLTLEVSEDHAGNEVVFHGKQTLLSHKKTNAADREDAGRGGKTLKTHVKQWQGWCYIHYGKHVHQTMKIKNGKRRSLILWYKEVLQ